MATGFEEMANMCQVRVGGSWCSMDAELTSDRIVRCYERDIERLQIDKIAELLGKAAYRKMAIVTKSPAQTGC